MAEARHGTHQDDPAQHGLDPRLITMAGMVVMWWGRVEHLLFTDMLDLRRDKAVCASGVLERLQMGTKSLIRQWAKAALIASSSQDEADEIGRLETALFDVAEDRHIIVHAFWPYPTPDAPTHVKLTSMKLTKVGDLAIRQYDVDPSVVEGVAGKAQRLYHRLLPLTLHRLVGKNRPLEALDRIKIRRRDA